MTKHHVTLVHHMPNAVHVHQRTYEARSPLHALEKLREEIQRDEVMLEEQQHANAVHVHVHQEPNH